MSYDFFIEKLKTNYKIVILIIISFFLLMTTLIGQEKTAIIEETIVLQEDPIISEEKSEKIFIDIKGAVKIPGVYEVKTEDRIIDAINFAGGLKADADTDAINLSQKLKDQMVIYIPLENDEHIEYPYEAATKVYEEDGLINLNNASIQEIMTLPGIGEVKAQAIINYRDEFGFDSVEDLLNVNGIGSATYNQIKDLVKV